MSVISTATLQGGSALFPMLLKGQEKENKAIQVAELGAYVCELGGCCSLC